VRGRKGKSIPVVKKGLVQKGDGFYGKQRSTNTRRIRVQLKKNMEMLGDQKFFKEGEVC
jgi:hypothetical protein